MAEAMVELQRVGRNYGATTVLKDVDLSIYAGEMIAITGPSGSGKTTILNLIGLLEKPNQGSLYLFGKPSPSVGSFRARKLLRTHIGYAFQNYALIDDASIKQNLDIPLFYEKISSQKKRERQRAALAQVGLADVNVKQKVYTLSGGEQQRVALARLLLKPCQIILADEPTGSLDAGNRDAVMQILHDLHDQGKTIVIVTHDEVVARSCERVHTLR